MLNPGFHKTRYCYKNINAKYLPCYSYMKICLLKCENMITLIFSYEPLKKMVTLQLQSFSKMEGGSWIRAPGRIKAGA